MKHIYLFCYKLDNFLTTNKKYVNAKNVSLNNQSTYDDEGGDG